jgi:hypothetical protein
MQHHPAVHRGPEIENQQRNGDGKDPVAERLDAATFGEQATGWAGL